MKRLLMFVSLLVMCGCVEPPSQKSGDCKEFDYVTAHNGVPVKCRIVYCGGVYYGDTTGGPAVLWCDEVPRHE